MRFRGIIILSICLVISLLAIFINPIKLGSWERGNNDNFLGMVLGLDLRGGTHLVYSITSNTGEEPTVDDAEGVRQIIDKRVNEFGVSEANVQLLGTPPNKILVQIPSQSGAQIAFSYSSDDPDLEQIKTQISEAGLEEFQIQKIEDQYIIEYDNLVDQNTIESIRNNLANTFQVKVMINFSPIRLEGKKEGEDLEFPNIEDIKPLLDQSNIDYDELNNKEFGAWEIVLTNFGYGDDNLAEQIMMSLSESKYNLVNLQPSGELDTFVASGGIQSAKRLIGSTAQLEFRVRECGRDKPENLDQNVWDLVKCYDPQYYNEVATGIESKNLTDASPGTVPELAQPVVNIVFDDDGSDIFYEVTDRISRTGDLLAIYLDNEELVSPGADKAISGGRAYIYGKDIDAERAREIAIQLRSGALPAKLDLIQERNVDAVLGSESLSKSLTAGVIGFVLVLIFMIAYYKIPGIIASLTLVIYLLFVVSIFKVLPVTLTLSGAAALILSIGFAVDANILISERIKEELLAGRNLLNSITVGFDRAWPSIRDGNFSTIITAVVLYWFGSNFSTSVMQGFALTLGLGVLLSMITSFQVNRILVRLITSSNLVEQSNLFIPISKRNKSGDN
ncbi:MAG: protein translocase subunit SecD [Chloroflexota bacterium]|nr:protein translocase subunit SecD [Chloroflexota bacterium]MEC9099350.1 protein translocase subunit SecD [Chloroflexota bacterium]MEC9107275.1 protein translocase subunit SecD [Chloroflexota bacterium]MED5255181.1 protein translocase subunit SecD [Chloroflexota bacterium]MQG23595.1 protein translocase subunit SecD [SAR202 cluster bacterium]